MKTPIRKRRRARSEEGAVMLIVLLVLLTATTLAATSLQTTEFELRSAGYNRAAIQNEYVSEAAAMTTFSWVDATTMDGSFMLHLQAWNLGKPPPMDVFGEPEIPDDNRRNSNRTQWIQQRALMPYTIPPITAAGYANGTFIDPIGTFGPRSKYVPGVQVDSQAGAGEVNFVVDMYDCRQLPNTATVGYQVNQGGSGSLHEVQFYCVVTSRGRSFVPYGTDTSTRPSKKWSVPGGQTLNGSYVVNRFTMAHDSRGTLVTPPIILSQ